MVTLRQRLQHRRVQRLLDALVDGELPPAVQDELADHLAACGACRDDTDAIQCIKAALARIGARSSAAGLRQRLRTNFGLDV